MPSPLTVDFARGGAAPEPAKTGVVGAALDVVASAAGLDTAGWNGTNNGHRGFAPGNQYGSHAFRASKVVSAQKAHTVAKNNAQKALRAHGRKRTSASLRAAQQATRTAAAAHRELEAARKAAQADKVQARKDKAMQRRVERSAAATKEMLTDRAHQKLRQLGAGAESGHHGAASILGGVEQIARSVRKDELFDVAKRAGIQHTAKTKGELIAHLQAHTLKRAGLGSKPPRPIDQPSHTDHPAGHVGYLNTDLIHADGARFQYKLGAAEGSGSVGSLAGAATYDHNLGGVLSVWKDPANGKVFVVNGHNRLDLAKKLGADKVTVRFLDARSAKEARSIGALQNIAEGRGSGLDAAKFFRDTGLDAPALAKKGIVLRDKVASDGVALSKLDDRSFRRVIDGSLTPERGAIIGGSGLEHHQQKALVDLIDRKAGKRSDELTNGQIRELIDDVKSSPTAKKTTNDLFGSSVEDESLALHRAKVSAFVKDKLSKEKRLFGLVSKSKNADDLARGGNTIDAAQSGQISQDAGNALAVFDQHKKLAGPVSRVLNEASERIYNGEAPKKVQDDAYRRVFAAVREIIR